MRKGKQFIAILLSAMIAMEAMQLPVTAAETITEEATAFETADSSYAETELVNNVEGNPEPANEIAESDELSGEASEALTGNSSEDATDTIPEVPEAVLEEHSGSDFSENTEDTYEKLNTAETGELNNAKDENADGIAAENDTVENDAADTAAASYTVTLDANGGYFVNEWDDVLGEYVERTKILNRVILSSDSFNAAVTPFYDTADGVVTFLGWGLEQNGVPVVVAGEDFVPVNDCVLYAVWKIEEAAAKDGNEESVESDAGAEEGSIATIAATIEEPADLYAESENEEFVSDGSAQQFSNLSTVKIDINYGQTEARNMLDDINKFRRGDDAWIWNEDNTSKIQCENINELEYDCLLEELAMQRVAEIALSYSHTRPDGTDANTFLKGYGVSFSAFGENIAAGYTSSKQVFEAWVEEDEDYSGQGHRRNMLASAFSSVGIGHAEYQGVHFWVQLFCDEHFPSYDCDAYDGNREVEVEICPDNVEVQMIAEPSTLRVPYCRSADLPEVEIRIRDEHSLEGQFCRVYTAYDWISESPQIELSSLGSYVEENGFEHLVKEGYVFAADRETPACFSGNISVTALEKKITVPVTIGYSIPDYASVTLENTIEVYDGTEKKPGVTVRYDDKILKEGTDYSLSYSDCISPGTASVIVRGEGQYAGEISQQYQIIENDAEIVESGSIDFSISWMLDSEGTLRLIGSDEMYLTEDEIPWAKNKKKIRKVIIEDGITSISPEAFSQCKNLEEVKLPSTLEEIRSNAFTGCEKLQAIEIPASITSMEQFCFCGCGLKSVTVPDSIEDLPLGCFSECAALETIVLPEKLETIGPLSFGGCERLTTIDLPPTLYRIGDSAFEDCKKLEKIDLPPSVSYLGSNAFHNCERLKSIELPDNITDIYDDTFWNCVSLEDITFPSNLQTIEMGAFMNTKIKKAILPASVTDISGIPTQHGCSGDKIGAFTGCSELQYVVLPRNLKIIREKTFFGCKKLKSIEMPAKLEEIEASAFAYCESLQSISLPESLKKIGEAAFQFNTKLENIVIPKGVNVICDSTFCDCKSLKELPFKNPVKSIGFQAFCGCDGLTDISIPGGIAEIGEQAFMGCESLKNVKVPARCKVIADYAFWDCKSLESIRIGEGTESIGAVSLDSSYLHNIYLPASIKKIGYDAFGFGKKTIHYSGTKSQWKAIDNYAMNPDYISGYTVRCKDGDLRFPVSDKKKSQAITIKVSAASISVGKTATVSITGAKGKKSYKSSNTAVAAVNASTGVIKAKKVGTVKITATSAATSTYNAASRSVTIKVVPAATSRISATNQAKGIKVAWKKVTGANGYIIYRNNKKVRTITNGTTLSWIDTAANTNGSKYVYKVVAKASTGNGTAKSLTTYRVTKPAVSSLKNSASKKMTVKWTKNAKATGYQIQYSTNKKYASGNKTATVVKAGTVSKVIGSLTKGKNYYVRIRTYKTVGGTKYWSTWSTVKSVKIK